MTLFFSNFYKLDAICNVEITGLLDTTWTRSHLAISTVGGSAIKPEGNGSGLAIRPLKLMPGIDVPGHPNAVADFVSMAHLNNLIYLVVSTRFPIFYVGITRGGLRKGIFDTGRLIHHARKMLAIRESSTSHTGGWLKHAVDRYETNLTRFISRVSDQQFNQNLLGDVYVAIAHCGNDLWSPASVEEAVLNTVERALNGPYGHMQKMNTAGSGRESIEINLPNNINDIFHVAVGCGDLSDLSGDWNVIPGDEIDACKSSLLVVLKQVGKLSLGDILGTALFHMQEKCRQTERAVFYIQGRPEDWVGLWAHWGPIFSDLSKDTGVSIELRFAR